MNLKIEQLSPCNIADLLALVREYQIFYQVPKIDDEKNLRHFSRFIDDTTRGIVFIAYNSSVAVGFCTIYFCFSSAKAEEIGVLNDIFVAPTLRNQGIGKSLIKQAMNQTMSRGLTRLQWLTAIDNTTAKHLYNQFKAIQSQWTLYVLDNIKIVANEDDCR